MKYTKSRALIQFESSVIDLLDRCIECKNAKIPYALKTLAFQGVILLTCSALENYFKSLIDDWIFSLKSKGATVKNIPIKTRKVIYLRSQASIFKSFSFNGNEHEASSKLKFDTLAFIVLSDSASLPAYIKGNHIYGNKKYPSVDNVKKMFSTLEIENIFKVINVRYKRNYELDLESFLGVREALAHEFPPSVTYKDAKRHLVNIQKVVKKIDYIAYSFLSKSSGYDYWPAVVT